jgi:hypothetical protein
MMCRAVVHRTRGVGIGGRCMWGLCLCKEQKKKAWCKSALHIAQTGCRGTRDFGRAGWSDCGGARVWCFGPFSARTLVHSCSTACLATRMR